MCAVAILLIHLFIYIIVIIRNYRLIINVSPLPSQGAAVAMTVFYPLDTARLTLQGRRLRPTVEFCYHKVLFLLVFSG